MNGFILRIINIYARAIHNAVQPKPVCVCVCVCSNEAENSNFPKIYDFQSRVNAEYVLVENFRFKCDVALTCHRNKLNQFVYFVNHCKC